jgi:hypothetical protein
MSSGAVSFNIRRDHTISGKRHPSNHEGYKVNRLLIASALVSITILAFTIFTKEDAAYALPARERFNLFDGEFEGVVLTDNRWFTFVPTMPGQSGDRSGTLTIYEVGTRKSCGSARVDMVGNFTLDTEEDTKVATIDRPRRALWNLNDCSIRFHNLYPNLD